MGTAIIGMLTDSSLRSDQAVEHSLILHAKAGKAWGTKDEGSV
jgi:hypothetical protein